jgi:hypothetical protein
MYLAVEVDTKLQNGIHMDAYPVGHALAQLANDLVDKQGHYVNYDWVYLYTIGQASLISRVDLQMARAQRDPAAFVENYLWGSIDPKYLTKFPTAPVGGGSSLRFPTGSSIQFAPPAATGTSAYYGNIPQIPYSNISASFIQHLPDTIGAAFEMTHLRSTQDHRMAPHETWQDFYDQVNNLYGSLIIAGDTFALHWRDDQNIRHTETFFIKSDGLTGLTDSIYEFITGKRINKSSSSSGVCTRHDPYQYVGLFETATYCKKCEVKLS